MKETKKQIGAEESLLKARVEGMHQLEKGSLRPHGKLWGMDVFSWYNPMRFELENVLSSFPSPVLWLGNEQEITSIISENPSCLFPVKLLCCYAQAELFLPSDTLAKIETYFGANQLNDALAMLKSFKKENGILLFTASGENWKADKETFEFFLDLHQNK